ncbi:MAG TPA: aminotransferase class I/II-fold pyridoxal phosphate-dependent enzyme [Urbifossiella sp.]|jgi:aspartate aminotransferase|nr:aminotransferase class I/II-fold pyridoxal phosphate-dependent enzyme [Urbifossiella sp.]
MSTPTLSAFARGLTAETAFDVLAVAKKLKAAGKDVIELQIGDSPYPSSSSAITAGKAAIDAGHTRYAPSMGLPEFRAGLAKLVREEFGIPAGPENVVVAPGAKPFEQFFCEMFVEPGDAVLVFEPAFPTYGPNLTRRAAKMVTAPLTPEKEFRPDLGAIERFLRDEPRAKAIFLNSPHNPTGGVATKADLEGIAALVRGTGVAVFCDEPYCHMVWRGRHESLLAEPGMMDRCVAAYTFSKSYSMSGWRCGFAVAAAPLADMIGKLINSTLSCAPPFVQLAGLAAITHDGAERDRTMAEFRKKVELLVEALRGVKDVTVAVPAGTFYVFPDVRPICRRLGITSHGLAMYLLEGADDATGVACLGGECFGAAGQGFLRFSTAEPDDRLRAAVRFLAEAVTRTNRVAAYLDAHPKYRA